MTRNRNRSRNRS